MHAQMYRDLVCTHKCTDINRSELFPWDASARRLEIPRTRPVRMVLF